MKHRKEVDIKFRECSLNMVRDKLQLRLNQRGTKTFASKHEILGIITEEYHELIEAVKNNDKHEFIEEILDVAVACVYGLACTIADTTDW